jgi:hypothetical protein
MSVSEQILLRVHDEIGVARVAELARGGIPLAPGVLSGPADVRLGDRFVQTRAVEWWPDGSIRWLGLAFLADVPRQGTAEYQLEVGVPGVDDGQGPRVTAIETSDGVAVDTGAVSFLVRRAPFDPLHGYPGVTGFDLSTHGGDGSEHTAAADPDLQLRVVEAGPVVVRILASGTYCSTDGTGLLDVEVEVEAVAGSAAVSLDCRFVNRESGASTSIHGWTASIAYADSLAACSGAFEAVHRTSAPFSLTQAGDGHAKGIFVLAQVEPPDVEWTDAGDPAYRGRWEWSELSGRPAKGWVDVELGGSRRLAVVVPRFFDDNPSSIAYRRDGVDIGLWPAGAGTLELTQGVAGTRRVVVCAHDGTPTEASRLAERAESPLVVEVREPAFASAAAPDVLAQRSGRHPKLESYMRSELFSWCLVGQATGFLDRGDCMQVPAGPRAGFTANNEHDAILALCLHYLRSGERAYLASAESYADHVIDVDVIHASERNFFEVGGVRAHGRNHVHYVAARTADGDVETSIDTGHMWVEGLLLLGAIMHRRRYVDAARGIGECLLRLEEIGWTRPEPGPRNSGWPLIAFAALYRSTLDERFLAAARRVAASALAAQGPDGRWTMRVGFWDGYCAWQNAVLLIGLARLLGVDPEPPPGIEAGFRAGSDALLGLGRYDDGGFIYLDRFDYRWVSRPGLIREALAAAYDLTGEERFLHAGLEGGSAWYRPSGGVTTSNDVAEWRGHLPFLGALDRAGLLQDLPSATVPAPAA